MEDLYLSKSKIRQKLKATFQQELDEKSFDIYIEPLGTLKGVLEHKLNVRSVVDEFIKSSKQSLLILGDSGMGKTLLSTKVAQQLWQDEKTEYWPVYIYLPTLVNEEGRLKPKLLETHLEDNCFLKKEEIAFLKNKNIKLLLILDGFDEVKWMGNIISLNGFHKWQVKLLCTCRPEALQLHQDYQQYFCHSKKYKLREGLLTEMTLCSFTSQQVDDYCLEYLKTLPEEEYKKLPEQWRMLETYQHYLKILPGLTDLVETPFILSMVVQILPGIVEQQKLENITENNNLINEELSTEQQHLTRVELYRCFTQQWLHTQASRLQEKQGSLNGLKGSLAEYLTVYAKNLAMHQLQAGKLDPVLKSEETLQNYLLIPTKKELLECYQKHDREFLEENIKDIRGGCLLKTHGKAFRFLHKSLLEYLAAEELLREALGLLQVGFYNNELNHSKKTYSTFQQELLVDEPEIIARLAELAQRDKSFEKALWAIIEASKKDVLYTTAAANAITVWHRAGFNLINVDLRYARLEGADLRSAILSYSQLDYANLSNVRLHEANLSYVNLENANLTGIQLGQWPMLKFGKDLICCAYVQESLFAENRVAVGDNKGFVFIYNANNWLLLKKLSNWCFWDTGFNNNKITCLAWHPNGLQLAVGSVDKVIRLWDMQNYSCLQVLKGHTDNIMCLSYHPNGESLASGSLDDSIFLWNLKNNQKQQFKAHKQGVYSLNYRFDGNQLASGGGDGLICLWDITKNAKLTCVLEGHTGYVDSLTYRPDGKQLASAQSNFISSVENNINGNFADSIYLWKVKKNKGCYKKSYSPGNVYSLAYNFDGKQLAFGQSNSIGLLDIKENVHDYGYNWERIIGYMGKIFYIKYSDNGKYLIVGDAYKTVRFQEISNIDNSDLFKSPIHYCTTVCLNSSFDSLWVAAGFSQRIVKLYNIDNDPQEWKTLYQNIPEIDNLSYAHGALHYSPNAQQLASVLELGVEYSVLSLWEVKSGKKQFEIRINTILCYLRYSPDNKYLVIRAGNNIYLWDALTFKEEKKFQHDSVMTCITFSPDGQNLALCGFYGIFLWKISTEEKKCVSAERDVREHIVYRPDGKQLASDYKWHNICLWNIKNNEEKMILKTEHAGGVSFINYSLDNKYLISTGQDHNICLCDINKGILLAKIKPFNELPSSLQFTKNFSLLILYCSGILLELKWSIKNENFQILRNFNCFSNPIISKEFNCSEARIDNCFGLSEKNKKVLEQYDAIGKPSTEKYWSQGISSALFKDTAPRKQPLQNMVGDSVQLNQFFGAVSLVRSKDGNHAFFLLEVATNRGHRVFYADLRTPSTLLEQSVSQAKAEITLELWKDDLNFSKLRQKVKEEFVYQTFHVMMENMKKLYANIEQDKHKEIYYSMLGGGSFNVNGRLYHNCMTWCEDKLKEIDIKLPEKWLKSPKLYLPEINIDEKGSSVKEWSNNH